MLATNLKRLIFAPQIRSTFNRFSFLQLPFALLSPLSCAQSHFEGFTNLKFKHRNMKQETMGFVIPINKEQMKELTKETKETLAVHAVKADGSNRTFGSVDLWNSRKNQRTMSSMRRWIN